MTSPDFQGFLVERDLMLKDPRVFDAGETNLYRVLADLRPETPALGRRIHRCHLAGHWLDACGFPAEWGARAFASSGVRHALAILCAHWKETGTRILLPNDVYPAYWRIAGEAGVQTTPFSTWPRLDGRSLDGRSLDADADADADADVVLLCEPAKPRGRSLDAEETRILLAWLRGSPARRVALDAVYAEIPEFTKATRTLISTGQTLLLHSLSKGWLHPGTFGIALVPETDARILAKRFQTAEAPQESLAAAEAGRRHVKLFPRRPD